MQPGGRTPSSILRKRASQEEQNQRRRSLRAKGLRRVSFAPDDELETMHLFKTDKNSPLPSQDTQPLAELVQNHMHPPQQDMLANLWHPEKPAAMDHAYDHGDDQFVMQSPAMPAQSPGLTGGLSPMSMELTNDTMQQAAGMPFAAAENDSLTLGAAYASNGFRDATHNITDNVPCLSTLVEEDEDELYNDTSTNGSAMELTGNTDAGFKSPPARPTTRYSAAAVASPAVAEPSPGRGTRSSRRSSKQGAPAASPVSDLQSPKTRSRRISIGRGKAAGAEASAPQQQSTPPAFTGAAEAVVALGGRRGYAPSQEPTPSPLRRITRSMTPDKAAGGDLSPLEGLTGFLEAGLGAAAVRNPRRSTLDRFANQQNKWGFIPGEEDTMMLDMNMPGAGGLGDATLHHVYSENTGTGEITAAVRQGHLDQHNAAAQPAAGAAGRGGRRRSSIGRHRPSLAAQTIPEESATPAATPAAQPATTAQPEPASPGAAADITEDMAISPDRTAGLLGQDQQHIQQEQETPVADGGAAGGQDADGMTTNLLLDDRSVGGWGHVIGARVPSTTGRGSVGSNMHTLHNLKTGHTTQLLADSSSHPGQQPFFQRHGSHGSMGPPAAGGAAAAAYGEECTTKLLADSTAASGVMGMFPPPRGGSLLGTIAGGAPVVHPPSAFAAAAVQQQEDFASPELGGNMMGSGKKTRARSVTQSPAPVPAAAGSGATAALEGLSPVNEWQEQEEQVQEPDQDTPVPTQQQRQQPMVAGPFGSASAAPAFGMDAISPPLAMGQQQVPEGSEPTLELAVAASQGGQTNALEDATLEDFAMPPDLGNGGEERPITMPFSGALSSLAANDTGPPGSVCRTPGGSIRQAQPITFTDFCQIVDMQFLTHIRRGTSISVMDFQPSSVPQDVAQALQLLSVTGNEVAVLEGAMSQLQSEMHEKRREAYEVEDRLGVENPPVFAAVQTARHTKLEQTKHCLVLLKKACRAATTTSWKQLRCKMEQELAERLAVQQKDMDEQLAFVQAKLQKAQQQREYAKSFHADVVRKLAAEEAAQQEAAAAHARLVSLRNRLSELKGLNADRQDRTQELQDQVQTLKERCADVDTESATLLARRDQLNSILAATPKPAHSRKAGLKLKAAEDKLEIVTALQGWRPTAAATGEWLISFQGLAGIRLSLPAASAADSLVTGKLEVLSADAVGAPAAVANYGVGKELLKALVSAMQASYNFQVPKAQLPLAFASAELALGAAVQLSEQCRELFMVQPLLTAVEIVAAAATSVSGTAAAADNGSKGPGWLGMSFIEADKQLKVRLLLCLDGLLANSHAGINSRVEVLVCPDSSKADALQQQLSSSVGRVLAAAVRGGSSSRNLLERVCAETTSCLLSAAV